MMLYRENLMYNKCMELAKKFSEEWWGENKQYCDPNKGYVISNPWVCLWRAYNDKKATKEEVLACLSDESVREKFLKYGDGPTGEMPKSGRR